MFIMRTEVVVLELFILICIQLLVVFLIISVLAKIKRLNRKLDRYITSDISLKFDTMRGK